MEAFSFLDPINSISGIRAGWVERVPDLPIIGDRDEAMRQLRPFHEQAIDEFASPSASWWRAEQVHGTDVAIVPGRPQIIAPDGLPVVPQVDGLVTQDSNAVLALYAADCGIIWLADAETGAIGLLHSGKKGSAGNIFAQALTLMANTFGTQPRNVISVLSPCIRITHYEIDFPSLIRDQAQQAGVGQFHDCGLNTANDLDRFYSYRQELGKTGRMMALITRASKP